VDIPRKFAGAHSTRSFEIAKREASIELGKSWQFAVGGKRVLTLEHSAETTALCNTIEILAESLGKRRVARLLRVAGCFLDCVRDFEQMEPVRPSILKRPQRNVSRHLQECTYSTEVEQEQQRLARLRDERERRDERLLDSWHPSERPGAAARQKEHLDNLVHQAEQNKLQHLEEMRANERLALEVTLAHDAEMEKKEAEDFVERRSREKDTLIQNILLAQDRARARQQQREADIMTEQTLLEKEEFERRFGRSVC